MVDVLLPLAVSGAIGVKVEGIMSGGVEAADIECEARIGTADEFIGTAVAGRARPGKSENLVRSCNLRRCE